MAYDDLKIFSEIAKEQGANIIKPIFSDQIICDFRATYQCKTCTKYGKKATCPPYIPDYDYFQRLLQCYRYGLIIGNQYAYNNDAHFDKLREESSPRVQNILLMLEHQAFARNFYWAISFIGGSCRGCDGCPPEGTPCKNPTKGRIPLEAIGVDVIETCNNIGTSIDPFPQPKEGCNLYRVGLFLLE